MQGGGQDGSGGHTAFFGSSSGGAAAIPQHPAPVLSSVQEGQGVGSNNNTNSSISSGVNNDILTRLNRISSLGQGVLPKVGNANNAHNPGGSGAFNPADSFTANSPNAYAGIPVARRSSHAGSSTGETQVINHSDSSSKAIGNQHVLFKFTNHHKKQSIRDLFFEFFVFLKFL